MIGEIQIGLERLNGFLKSLIKETCRTREFDKLWLNNVKIMNFFYLGRFYLNRFYYICKSS